MCLVFETRNASGDRRLSDSNLNERVLLPMKSSLPLAVNNLDVSDSEDNTAAADATIQELEQSDRSNASKNDTNVEAILLLKIDEDILVGIQV